MAQTLITVQEVLDYGNLNNDALRPRITALLASVFAAGEEYCGRKFSSESFTEYFDAVGQSHVTLANPPATVLNSVTDDAQNSARSIDTGADVLWLEEYKRKGEVRLYNAEGSFNGGIAGVKVVYTGGWTSSTIPLELKNALCAEVLFQLGERAIGIGSQSADGVSMTYRVRGGFAEETAQVLDKYRLWWKEIG